MTLSSGRLLIVGHFGVVNDLPSDYGLARLLMDDAPSSVAVFPYWRNREGFEGMGEAEITVRRLGDVRGAATVNYRTQDGSAHGGTGLQRARRSIDLCADGDGEIIPTANP